MNHDRRTSKTSILTRASSHPIHEVRIFLSFVFEFVNQKSRDIIRSNLFPFCLTYATRLLFYYVGFSFAVIFPLHFRLFSGKACYKIDEGNNFPKQTEWLHNVAYTFWSKIDTSRSRVVWPRRCFKGDELFTLCRKSKYTNDGTDE